MSVQTDRVQTLFDETDFDLNDIFAIRTVFFFLNESVNLVLGADRMGARSQSPNFMEWITEYGFRIGEKEASLNTFYLRNREIKEWFLRGKLEERMP